MARPDINRTETSILPFIALTLHHLVFCLNTVMFNLRQEPYESLIAPALANLFGITLAALILWPLTRGLDRTQGPQKFTPLILLKILLLAALVALPAAVRLAGMELWLREPFWRLLMAFSYGSQIAPVYYLFFSRMPTGRQGSAFGLSLALGLLAIFPAQPAFHMLADQEFVLARLSVLFKLHGLGIMLLSAVLGLALWRGLFTANLSAPPPDIQRARRGNLPLTLTAVALFFAVNSLLGVRLVLFMTDNWQQHLLWLPPVLALTAVLAGRYLDRKPQAAKHLLLGCATLFVLTPSLSILDNSPEIFLSLYVMSIIAQMLVSMTAPLFMARLARPGPLYAIILCSTYLMQIIIVPAMKRTPTDLLNNAGLMVLGGTAFALLLHQLVSRLNSGLYDAERPDAWAEPPVPEKNPGPPILNEPEARRKVVPDIFSDYQLSPREREVAQWLIKGAGTREIAEKCAISEHTVRTHVKKILRKFNVPSRKALLAACISQYSTGEEVDPGC
ncbi:hypothetical protein C4J81_00595 [Deltaproteobacteria bacterium Smac51]|nr:hypothetical protein C4J81_00595 [Deltaproteobacteria bacterium Smac51]